MVIRTAPSSATVDCERNSAQLHVRQSRRRKSHNNIATFTIFYLIYVGISLDICSLARRLICVKGMDHIILAPTGPIYAAVQAMIIHLKGK